MEFANCFGASLNCLDSQMITSAFNKIVKTFYSFSAKKTPFYTNIFEAVSFVRQSPILVFDRAEPRISTFD